MVFVHCGQIDGPDLRTVDLLARVTLRARRAGNQARLAFVSKELLQLIAFVGLDGMLLLAAGFPPRNG